MPDRPSTFARVARAASGPLAVLGALLLFRGALLWGSVPAGIDSSFFHLPFYSLRSLQFFPLWNPFEFCGLPTAGNPQFGSFYPPAFIFAWPDAAAAYRLFIFAHYYWAGLGMWFVARRWGLGWGPALAAAVAFMCGGYMFGRVSNPVVFLGCAWMPWVLWAAHRAWSSRTPADAALAGVVFALMAHAGSPHGMVYGAILTALFLAAAALAPRWTTGETKKWNDRDAPAARALRSAGLLALGIAVYLGLHAPALLPALEHMKVSVREAATFEDIARDSLPWRWLPALILGGSRLPEYTDATTYIGLMPWLAALMAAAMGRAERRWAFPLALMMAGAGLALGRHFIFYRALAAFPVGSELIGPMRALVLWAMGASLLTGMAFDCLRGVERRRALFIGASVMLAVAAAALLWVMPQIVPRYRWSAFINSRSAPPDLFVWLNVGLGAALMALWLGVAGWKPRAAAWREGVFLLFMIGDLIHFSPRVFIYFRDQSWFDPPRTVAAVMPSADSPFAPRVIGHAPTQIFNESEDDARTTLHLQPKLNDLYRIPSASGFDPVFIRRYGELVNALGLREPLDDPMRTIRFTSARHPFLNFAQVGWVIGDPWERAISRQRLRITPDGETIPLSGAGEWAAITRTILAPGNAAMAGDSPTSPALPRVRAVRLLHYTGGTTAFPEGFEAGRLTLWSGARPVAEFPVRMGVEVADQLALTPGIGTRHGAPNHDRAWPAIEFLVYHAAETRTACMILTEFRLPAPVAADRIVLTRGAGWPEGPVWIVEAVSVVDEGEDGMFERTMPDRAAPVWRNLRAQPFAWAAGAVERAADDAAGLARLREFSARDWAERVVLAPRDGDGGFPLPENLWTNDKAPERTPNEVRQSAPRVDIRWVSTSELLLTTESAQPFLVAISQLWHPGWRASLADGSNEANGEGAGEERANGKLDVLRVNHAFQGVVAPAGRHTIRLRFWPHGLTLGLIAAAAVHALLVAVWRNVCSRRNLFRR